MRVLVVTVVHHPEDARICHREIAALRQCGHHVRYAAPFSATRSAPRPGVDAIDVPRAVGKRRWPAFMAARRVLADNGADADVVLLHDPELLLTLPGLARRWQRCGRRPVVVWDVHEDTAASLAMKHYLPRLLRWPLQLAVRSVELAAERRLRLILAETAYQQRFRSPHTVVPNAVQVPALIPDAGSDRVVYLGHLSRARGALDLIEVARRLPPGLRLEVIGAADPNVRGALADAQRDRHIRWHGFIPNDRALGMLRGAMAGISLLHDQPNYRHSMPTKMIEYMANGLPVVTTPNRLAVDLVRRFNCGVVVPFADPGAAAAALGRLRDDPTMRAAMGSRGHLAALTEFNWHEHAGDFVRQLERWVVTPIDANPGSTATDPDHVRAIR